MDVFSNTTDVDAMNITSSNSTSCPSMTDSHKDWSGTSVMIGSLIAVVAQLLSGVSLAIRKKALTSLASTGARSAAEGGLGYLKSKLWWLGFIILAVCQGAYGISISLTTAIVAAPLAVLSIAGSAIGGRLILKDWIGPFGWMGCAVLMSSCAIFAISAPVEIDLASPEEANQLYTSINFIAFVGVIFVIDFIILVLFLKHGYRHILALSFLVGSSSSVAFWLTKGIGVYFTAGAFQEWPLWVAVIFMVFVVLFNVYTTHICADMFLTSHAAATAYVIFSTLVIICATGLFPLKMNIGIKDGFVLGLSFIIIVVGLFVLNIGKYVEFDFKLLEENPRNEQSDSVAVESSPSRSCDNESFTPAP